MRHSVIQDRAADRPEAHREATIAAMHPCVARRRHHVTWARPPNGPGTTVVARHRRQEARHQEGHRPVGGDRKGLDRPKA